jgi:hypothetical protein
MPDTVTDKYDLTKPEVEASQDTWGDKLNADFDAIDALLFNRVIKNLSGKDSIGTDPQVMGLHLNLPLQSLVGPGTTDPKLVSNSAATCRWVEYRIFAMLDFVIPVGTIIMWSGTLAAIGTLLNRGWAVCNGAYGTPNLADRIVLAAGGQHPAGEFAGNVGPGLGAHVHQGTAIVDSGEAAAPDFTNDFQGQALYSPGNTTTLPYYTVCYMMKWTNFTMTP